MNDRDTMMRAEESGTAPGATQSFAERGSAYVDDTSSRIGRGLQSAGEGVSTRAQSASDSMIRAGRYLETSRPGDMQRDLNNWVRQNPAVSLCLGFGVGLLIGRAISR